MASGGAKNVVLIIIAIGAIGGAIYGVMQSMNSGGSTKDQEMVHFILISSDGSAEPKGVTMTVKEFRNRASRREKIVIDGSDEVAPAGIGPNGLYYMLGGHGTKPEVHPTTGESLADYDIHGNKIR